MAGRLGVCLATAVAGAIVPLQAVAQSGDAVAAAQSSAEEGSRLGAIVVTAQKRGEQSLLDTPIAISAFQGDDLERTGKAGVADYLQSVPGVGIVETSAGVNQIQIRGISSTFGDALVGYYLDDLPFTLIGNAVLPDARSFDLERVEVLRGPQGTLYGAGSLGGTVRIITKNPDLEKFGFKVDASGSSTEGGGENYDLNAAINIPIVADQVGLRLAGGYADFAGWLDSPLGSDVNDSQISNLRAKLLVEPTDDLSIVGSVWLSRIDNGSGSQADVAGVRPQGGPESSEYTYDLYNLAASYDAGAFTLFNATSYIRYRLENVFNIGSPAVTALPVDTWTNETRLSSEFDGALNFMVGGFYSDVDEGVVGQFGALQQNETATSKSWAVFGETYLSLLDDRLNITAGLRYFEDERTSEENVPASRALLAALGRPNPRESKVDSTSPRLNIAYRLADSALVYANVAKGFRSGFNQPGISVFFANALGVGDQVPAAAQPETLWSYEVGFKADDLLGGRVSVEAAAYYNDWEDIIVVLPIVPTVLGNLSFVLNGPSARSYGGELSVGLRPIEGLALKTSVGYVDAEYTESEGFFLKGERLDNVPKMTLNGSVDYVRPLGDDLDLIVHADTQFNSKRYQRDGVNASQFLASNSVVRTNLRVGLQKGKATATIFADNVFNEDGAVDPLGAGGAGLATRYRPRTIGLNLRYEY